MGQREQLGLPPFAERAFRLINVGAVLLAFTSSNAMAANRIFDLYIQNIDSKPITMTLSTDDHNCYEGSPALGEVFENVTPGSKVKITIARVQGHGCNGHQGEFSVVFDPGVGVKKIQHFDFDNQGGLELTQGRVNVYPGNLSAKSPKDGSYTYTTFKSPDVTAGPAVGSWTLICQQICNRTLARQLSNEATTGTRHSVEITNAITASLESGIKFEGIGGVKGTITTSEEKKIGDEMSQSYKRGETNTDTSNYVFTPEEMKSLNIFAIWQWVATTKLSDNEEVLIRSNKFTCTPNADTPNYFPGSPEDLKACKGS